MLFGW
jgi:hypothetical protein